MLFEVKEADIKAQSSYRREEKEKKLKEIHEIYDEILACNQCVSLKGLAVTGRDLIEDAGMKPGKELGEMLKKLLNVVIEEPAKNEKEILIKLAREFK